MEQWLKNHNALIKKYTNLYEKIFINWRNEWRDIVAQQLGYDFKSKSFVSSKYENLTIAQLTRILTYALEISYSQAEYQAKQLMKEYGTELNTDVVMLYLDKYDYDYRGSTDYVSDNTVQQSKLVMSRLLVIAGAAATINNIEDLLPVPGTSVDTVISVKIDDVDKTFTDARDRSETISTTQSELQVQDSLVNQYDMQGVEFIEWDAILDGKTRPTHAANHGLVRKLGDTFPNGLRYPGDPAGPPEEVINCRCTSIPKTYDQLTDEQRAEAGV